MLVELMKIYERDLSRLEEEINAFREESNLWKTMGQIKNSAGNLCLHLIGNLNTFIGKNLGDAEYTRDRDAEFSLKDVPRQALLEGLHQTKGIVSHALSQMKAVDLEYLYKEEALGYPMTNGFFLIHLAGHLSYHLGQINYLRRTLEV